MTIDFNALELVARVARAGSFTAAARELGATKQWVSRRVADAERSVGVPLLERTTRSLRPTAAGRRVLEQAAPAFAVIAASVREAEAHQTEAVGTLRVSAPLLFGRHFLVPVVAAYRAANPAVRLEIQLTDRLVNLPEEEVDVAVRVGQSPDSSLFSRRLGRATLQLVGAPSLLASGVDDEAAMSRLPALVSRADERWVVDGRRLTPDAALIIDHLETKLEAARQGLGIALLPTFLVRPLVQRGELVALLGGQPVSAGVVQVVSRYRTGMPARVRRFVDLLVARAPDLA